jgi:uncharacterized protein (TIGR02270 family)
VGNKMASTNLHRPIEFRPRKNSSLVIEEVVAQHAEEAAFLWTQRDRAVHGSRFELKDVAALDDRVEAHLDGLRIAGQFGWAVCEKALGQGAPGEAFAAAVLAFESGDAQRIQRIADGGCDSLELQRALISALGWPSYDKVGDTIKALLISEPARVRRLGVAAHAIHRKDPGSLLLEALSAPDPQLRARALKAVGELGRTDALPVVQQAIWDQDDRCRFFAAWSAARLGSRTALVLETLRKITEVDGPYAERALEITLRCMECPQAKNWRRELREDPSHLRLAAVGSGMIGDPEYVGDLVALMEVEKVARVAGEAFSMITGADLSDEDLERSVPEGFEAGPNEDPADDNVALDPDENLPWPDPRLVMKWWEKRRNGFRPGVRYMRGKEITTESLKNTLVAGTQRQRAAAALELGLRAPADPLFEVRAPGWRQLKSLTK